MSDITIDVVALVASNEVLTFYKTDGTVYTVTQGDPRGQAMVDEFTAQKALGIQPIKLVIEGDHPTLKLMRDREDNPLIRFFRAPIAAIKKLFGSDDDSSIPYTEETHEAAAQRVREFAEKAFKAAQKPADEPKKEDDLPLKLVTDASPMGEDETIIAVTADGVVPSVENMAAQMSGTEGTKADTQGPDALIMRMAKMSAKRGHTVQDLMNFIKKIDLPILPDGSFLAYKRLLHKGNGVYVDPHSQRVHQRIGDVVQMDEKMVDPDRRRDCSNGLHVGSRHYMGSFHKTSEGSGTMLVLIQPEDAIAVPAYDSTKMRACRYTILADLSNKAHDLVNEGKRMDDCADTMAVVSQIVAGARPAMLGIVNIAGDRGTDLTYTINGVAQPTTDMPFIDALAVSKGQATGPTRGVKTVKTVDDSLNEKKSATEASKVRDKSNAVKPDTLQDRAQGGSERVKTAAELYARMTDKDNSDADRRKAAVDLKEHKRVVKISYKALGLPEKTGDEIQEILDIVSDKKEPAKVPAKADPKPSKPAPSKPQAKKPEPVKTAPQPKQAAKMEAKPKPKAEPAKATGGTRQDRARDLWDVISTSKDPMHKKKAAQQLRDFKKSAKVSWDALGLGKHNVEAELKKLLD